MKRRPTIGTFFFGIGACLITIWQVTALAQEGWHDYMCATTFMGVLSWLLVYLSFEPKED